MGFGIFCEVQFSAVPVFVTRYDMCMRQVADSPCTDHHALPSTLVSKQLEALARDLTSWNFPMKYFTKNRSLTSRNFSIETPGYRHPIYDRYNLRNFVFNS